MKNILHITALLILSTLCAHAQTNTAHWQWMHSIGGGQQGPNTQDKDEIVDFRVDKWGNSYMAGRFYNSIDIQNIHIEVPPLVTNNQNTTNGFIAKFDCDGNVEWANKWGSADGGAIWNILPTDKYVYVNGVTNTQQNYPCYMSDSVIANLQWGFVGRALARYDLDGNLLSYKLYDKRLTIAQPRGLLQEDADGNLIGLAGSDSAYIDGHYLEKGFHLLKLDTNGNYLDNLLLGAYYPGSYGVAVNSLKIDMYNNIYITGGIDSFYQNFHGVTPDYGDDMSVGFTAKFDNDFNLIWFEQSNTIGTNVGTCSGRDIAIDEDKNVYVCYGAFAYNPSFNRGVIFQGDTIFNEITGSVGVTVKYVILKYDSLGNMLWVKNTSSNYANLGAKFDYILGNDNLYLYGLTPSGAFKFDTILTTLSAHSLFIAKFDLDGNILDINFIPHSATVIADVSPFSLQLSSNNNIYITGTQQQSIIFPDSTLNPLHGSGSNRDIFIAKYGVNQCFRCDSVQPAFTVAQNIGYTAQVSSNTTINAETYLWDFGNGQTSADSLPTLSITYPDTGTYTVCLTAQNYCDTQTHCQQIHIGCPPPLASGYTYTTGTNSIEIQSVNIQQYDSYIWYFGDGESSTDSLPQHNYTASGIYNVCIAVQNTCGTDSFCQSINITCPPPQIQSAGLHIDTLSIAGTGVSLQNQDSVYWAFGDGQNSTQTNPVHTYAQTGTYNVCLTAYNTCGDTTYCQEVSVVGTGIVQLSDGGIVKVYPNPAQSYINIELQNTVESLQVRIIDLQGKVYMKTKIKPSKEQIDLSTLSSGIYFIQLKDKQGEYSIKILKE